MIKYKLGDVVKVISERVDNPASSGYEKFVGLEHYVSGEIEIKQFGDTSKLKSAMKVFKSGDILIARRNVYLKRASIVRFDGITSGDSIILRIEDRLLRSLIPFVLNTDDFWGYAEKFSDGTMSKRLSPKVLLEYEFMLPQIDKQEKFSELLWAANDTKEKYKRLISLTDELVKAQFTEVFGELGKDEYGWGLTTLGHCCELNPKRPRDILDDTLVSFVAMPSVSENGDIDTSILKTYGEVRKGFTYFAENDVLFAKITPCMENGKGAIATGLSSGIGAGSTEFHVLRPLKGISNPFWLYIITMFESFRTNARKVMTGSGGQLRVPIGYLSEFPISLPPIELQNQFADFVKQTNKSKVDLQQNLANLEITIKALMAKNLG
ncbi:restriction endonuclease subunit S [Gudongella sp. DL1XJH-153]|uniref:restriction endonuclease subunit S n=1 Tax=Gudongella sp. DL1XJH-153 TaxID=3409804 RepID=UPI003BB6D03F